MSFFATEFGFDANETVALMGAHTLGGADPGNSGFTGIWIHDEALFFNNEYYKVRRQKTHNSFDLIFTILETYRHRFQTTGFYQGRGHKSLAVECFWRCFHA